MHAPDLKPGTYSVNAWDGSAMFGAVELIANRVSAKDARRHIQRCIDADLNFSLIRHTRRGATHVPVRPVAIFARRSG